MNANTAPAPVVHALLDMSHKPVGGEWTHQVDECEIPIAPDFALCEHGETICPDCADSWGTDYIFTSPLPWA
jgi:hypothetical protein